VRGCRNRSIGVYATMRISGFSTRLRINWKEAALLGIASVSRPLQIATSNIVEIAHPERLALFTLAVWLGGLSVLWSIHFVGASRRCATAFSFFAILGLTRGLLIIRLFQPLIGWVVLIVGVLVVSILVSRISESAVFAVLLGCAVFLLSGSLAGLYRSVQDWGTAVVTDTSVDVPEQPTSTPDIFLVVFDGYGGTVAMEEDFGIERPPWVNALRQQGFEVPNSSWSSYPTTTASLPSLLNMSHPLVPGTVVSLSTINELYYIIGGHNNVTETLTSWGYSTTMVEAGWGGSSCGSPIDRCVTSPFVDEAMFFTLAQSVLARHMVSTSGYAFTAGARASMTWLLDNAQEIADNGQPDFVFAHVMAPHAPFFLDRDCGFRYTPEGTGIAFQRPGVDRKTRDTLYLKQASCVDTFMVDLATLIPEDSVIVFMADHGTNRRSQQTQQPEEWDANEIVERFNILLAVRSTGCEMGDPVQVPSIFRRILACLGGTQIPDLDPAMFVYVPESEVVMVDPQVVDGILSRSSAGLNSRP
jgi:hypothetical protein